MYYNLHNIYNSIEHHDSIENCHIFIYFKINSNGINILKHNNFAWDLTTWHRNKETWHYTIHDIFLVGFGAITIIFLQARRSVWRKWAIDVIVIFWFLWNTLCTCPRLQSTWFGIYCVLFLDELPWKQDIIHTYLLFSKYII